MQVIAHHCITINADRKNFPKRQNARLNHLLSRRVIEPGQGIVTAQPSPPNTPRHAAIVAGLASRNQERAGLRHARIIAGVLARVGSHSPFGLEEKIL